MRTNVSNAVLAAALATVSLVGCKKTETPAGTLTGKATYAGEADSSGISVSLNGPVAATALTDASGDYQFNGLPPGSYALLFTPVSALEAPQIRTAVVGSTPGVSAADVVFTAIGALSGKVTLGAATGNAGILVVSPGSQSIAVTDDSGAYTLSNLSTGAHDLIASAGALGTATASAVTVVHGQTTTVADMTIQASPGGAGTISGQVVLAGVTSPAGIPVALQGPSSAAVLTDANGNFSFSGLNDGQYSLTAVVHDALTASQKDGVEVLGGVAQSTPDFHFTPTGTIVGTATFGTATTGNAGITVTSLGLLAVAVTDDSGNYQLSGVPVGTHDLIASYPGKASATASQIAVTWAQSTSAPALTLQNAAPLPGLALGHALFNNLTDSSGILVSLAGVVNAAQVTLADGSFSFGNLPDGTYTLTASATSTLEGSASRSFAITDGTPVVAGQDFALTPVGTIQGQVVNGSANVPGAIVLLEGGQTSALTGSGGSYSLANVPAGKDAVLSAIGLGFASPTVTVSNLGRGQTVTAPPLDVALVPSQQVSLGGQIQLLGESDASAATIAWTGPTSGSAPADANGNWSGQVNPGLYSLSVTSSAGPWSETVPGVLAFPGGDGFAWQDGLYPLNAPPLDVQYAKRIASAGFVPEMFTNYNTTGEVAFLIGPTCNPLVEEGCYTGEYGLGLYANGTTTVFPGAISDENEVTFGPRNTLLYSQGSALYLATAQGPRLLTSSRGSEFTPPPSDRFTLFMDNANNLYSLDVTSATPPVVLASGINYPYYLQFTPDDLHLWFSGGSQGYNGFNTVVPSGGCAGASNCPVAVPNFDNLQFSNDGTAVFASGQAGWYLVAPDGTQVTQLNLVSSFDVQIATSATNAQFVLVRNGQAVTMSPFTLNATATPLATMSGSDYCYFYPGGSYVVVAEQGNNNSQQGPLTVAALVNNPTPTTLSPNAQIVSVITFGGDDYAIYLDTFSQDGTTGTLEVTDLASGVTTSIAPGVLVSVGVDVYSSSSTAVPTLIWSTGASASASWFAEPFGSQAPATAVGSCPAGDGSAQASNDGTTAAMLCEQGQQRQLMMTRIPGGTPVTIPAPADPQSTDGGVLTLDGIEGFDNSNTAIIYAEGLAAPTDIFEQTTALVTAQLDASGTPVVHSYTQLEDFFPAGNGLGEIAFYRDALDGPPLYTESLAVLPPGASQFVELGHARDWNTSGQFDEYVIAQVNVVDPDSPDDGIGQLIAARADGTVQVMIDNASEEFALIPGTNEYIGARQRSPAPWGFQDGVYVGSLPAPATPTIKSSRAGVSAYKR